MESGQHQVDPEIRKDHREKPHSGDDRHLRPLPSAYVTSMKVDGIHEPGDERPRFLRVPAPVSAPRAVRPDRSGDDAAGQKRPADGDHTIGHVIELIQGGHVLLQQVFEAYPLRPDEPEQGNDRQPGDNHYWR